uniref:Uncharacterized protein n=1 Tax=Globodera rostochiensis TaxID=31243 RepID=A0A914HFS8_GLORO
MEIASKKKRTAIGDLPQKDDNCDHDRAIGITIPIFDMHQQAQQKHQRRFKDEMVYGGKDQKAKPSRNRYVVGKNTVGEKWQLP